MDAKGRATQEQLPDAEANIRGANGTEGEPQDAVSQSILTLLLIRKIKLDARFREHDVGGGGRFVSGRSRPRHT
jgi:hypothetical protein